MAAETVAKFVSQKLSKIRWRPAARRDVQAPDVFATGSWDDVENHVSLWTVAGRGVTPGGEPGQLPTPDNEPELLSSCRHHGDVTDMQFVSLDVLAVASSTGSVSLYKLTNQQGLTHGRTWTGLHHLPQGGCPCTGLAVKETGDTMVTVGEDGRITVLALEQAQPIRVIERGDSCSVNAVTFMKQYEVGTVNSTGQLKLWDLRTHNNSPVQTFFLSGDRVPLHCLDKHPTQPHIVATGGQESTLSIWDMRQDKFPVTLLSAHSADMWEVRFHPAQPDHLFTCSEDGSVWHWDGSSMANTHQAGSSKGLGGTAGSLSSSHVSPWLTSDASKHRLDVTDVLPGNTMPVNSLDITHNTLLCATDGEQVYTVNNLNIQ